MNDSNVTAYKLDSKTGALTLIAGSPCKGVDSPTSLAMSPDSHLLAVGNLNGSGISVFRMDLTNGSLTAVAGSPLPADSRGFPLQTAFHPSGKFLYMGMQTSSTSDVVAFSVDASAGTLTPLPGSPFHGQTLIGVGGVNSIACDPKGKFVFASGNFGGITSYSVDSSRGALNELLSSPLPTPATSFNSKITVDTVGKFLCVADFDNDGVWVFPINADGSLKPAVAGSPFASGVGPRDIALDPRGEFAFVPNEGDLNDAVLKVDPTTGARTLVDSADTGYGPSSVAVDSSEKYPYVTNYWDGTVSAYTIDAASGALAAVAGSPFAAQDGPISVVITKVR